MYNVGSGLLLSPLARLIVGSWSSVVLCCLFIQRGVVGCNEVHRSPFLGEIPPELADCSTKQADTSRP